MAFLCRVSFHVHSTQTVVGESATDHMTETSTKPLLHTLGKVDSSSVEGNRTRKLSGPSATNKLGLLIALFELPGEDGDLICANSSKLLSAATNSVSLKISWK